MSQRRRTYNGTIRPADPGRTGEDNGNTRLLIERYVEQKEATKKGNRDRIKEIDAEIKGLLHEREEIEEWANA
jgi:hypothetical protein